MRLNLEATREGLMKEKLNELQTLLLANGAKAHGH
jgi:hypothetical protein